ncbi:TetR/AcrR family transcriptional regulator [Bacteroides salyersiae]|uniref:TetR/AcrR family transcriptional regulator n=1 Tax=Bacteroides salyersiae TaxID=291644 RepID=UPI001C37EB88|nr:TetR/AcrR family transcriptional regulator [Bacteroides salyersiae]MBV4203674.1 TetR/AcrR family transcriptional regulator [Bacteroides salyersiae]MCB6648756.1 TetR/AcrR family transcriptional regulator [Bacteroides salyersiae]
MATNDNNIENKIIETAQQLFVKNGFTDTNMSDIAAAVGINRPTLHYYFRTKDKMFQAVFGNIILSLAPEIQGIMVQDKPISERIGKVVDAYFKIFTDNPSLPIFIVREIERDMPHLISTARALELERYFHEIGVKLQKEMDSGKLKQVPIHFVFYTFYGLLVFPFLAKKLSTSVFLNGDEDFYEMLQTWKSHIIGQMEHLLCP